MKALVQTSDNWPNADAEMLRKFDSSRTLSGYFAKYTLNKETKATEVPGQTLDGSQFKILG
jgi:hypothetical protein